MPKMKKDEAVRASLMRDGVVKSDAAPMPMHIRTSNKAQSQAAAIAARRAELTRKQGEGK